MLVRSCKRTTKREEVAHQKSIYKGIERIPPLHPEGALTDFGVEFTFSAKWPLKRKASQVIPGEAWEAPKPILKEPAGDQGITRDECAWCTQGSKTFRTADRWQP